MSVSSHISANLNQQIRSRIRSLKNTAALTQKFFQKRKPSDKYPTDSNNIVSSPQQQQQQPPSLPIPITPTTDSKSWFQRWNFGQNNNNNSSNNSSLDDSCSSSNSTNIQDKEYVYVVNDRPLNSIKADIIHAFLSVSFYFLLRPLGPSLVPQYFIFFQDIRFNPQYKQPNSIPL
jgi:hypothetical protein